MKDMTGTEICTGDTIVYAVGGGNGRCELVEATVERSDESAVRVVRKDDPKMRIVVVHFPSRCRIVKQGPCSTGFGEPVPILSLAEIRREFLDPRFRAEEHAKLMKDAEDLRATWAKKRNVEMTKLDPYDHDASFVFNPEDKV